ncbi:MAG TPA: nuclear transport factor 2 family protein [Thermoplasmata archaeon]|nr:nuclear transport factor 2 family protein [Thermoplasmata archaeon]
MGMVEDIRELEERLRRGDSDSNLDTSAVFDELLADDVLFVQGPGNSVGKAGVLKGHQPPRKRTFSKVENHDVEIRDLGSTVAVSCRTDYAIQDRSFSLRALRLWKRVGQSWKVAVVALMEVPKDDE